MSIERDLDYPITTDELRLWLNARSLPCWGTRKDMIVERVKHELLQNKRVLFRKEFTTPLNGLHPAMLQGKRITKWIFSSDAHQIRLMLDSLEIVTFYSGEVPKVYIDHWLLKTLLTLKAWKDGYLVSPGSKGSSLTVLKGEFALQTSKVAGRRVGEYFPRAWCEQHVVIGLQLQGMDGVGYIFAHDDREVDLTSAYGNMKMGPLVSAAGVLGLPGQQYPDPGRWGQVSGIRHADESTEAATTVGLPNERYPDPSRWAHVSGIGHAGETGEETAREHANEIAEDEMKWSC